jgi:7-cyano-7-deazaguanine synthase
VNQIPELESNPAEQRGPLCVLHSGGVDSAVLTWLSLQDGTEVQPLYIRAGMKWEDIESRWLERFLAAIAAPNLLPVREVSFSLNALYGSHWSVGGPGRPGFDAPNEADYLPGRNIILLSVAGVFCARSGIQRIASGVLASNPFPDATDQFFDGMAEVLTSGLAHRIRIERPFARLHKEDVVKLGAHLPLDLTFTCNNPIDELHCGDCNKCAERQQGFVKAGVTDPTTYARNAQESLT